MAALRSGTGLGLAHPHHPVQGGRAPRTRRCRPGSRPGGGRPPSAGQVGVLAVEAGGQGFTDRRRTPCGGGRCVAPIGSRRPDCRGVSLDELTQMALAAASGDRAAVAAFVRRTQPEVWRLCARLGDRAEADDLTQEVYLRALPALARFRADALGPHLAAADRPTRLRRPRAPVHPPPRAGDAPRPAGRPRRGGGAEHRRGRPRRRSSPRLEPDRRAAFVLTQVLGLSYAEAAEVCEVPVGTIRSRVARARADLLDALADDAGDAAGRPRIGLGHPAAAARAARRGRGPLVPRPLPPSMVGRAGQVGEPPARLGQEHGHRPDVVGLHDRVDHRATRPVATSA